MSTRALSEVLLALARKVGREAADFVQLSRPIGRVDVAATKSSPTDDVTEIDRACEELIRTRILSSRPGDGFVGEEGHDIPGASGVEWIVDPIDGTVNFVYGIPAYAVSIAAAIDSTVVAGMSSTWSPVRSGRRCAALEPGSSMEMSATG